MISRIMIILCLVFALSCSSAPKIASDNQIRSSVVRLLGNKGTCSGEQVQAASGDSYILTAGHCKEISDDGKILVTTEDGRMLYRRIIMEDPHSDLMLLEGVPNLPALPIAGSIRKYQHIRTFTHGNNLDTYITEGVVIQNQKIMIPISEGACADQFPKYQEVSEQTLFGTMELCVLNVVETVTNAKIVPGSSGGAIVNNAGELVGVASASGEYFSYLVTLKDVHQLLDNY